MAMEGIYVIPLFAETHNEFPLVKAKISCPAYKRLYSAYCWENFAQNRHELNKKNYMTHLRTASVADCRSAQFFMPAYPRASRSEF